VSAALRWKGNRDAPEFLAPFTPAEDLRFQKFTVLPCDVGMAVDVNGREVVGSAGATIQLTNDDYGAAG
jgi:hypothetical protein